MTTPPRPRPSSRDLVLDLLETTMRDQQMSPSQLARASGFPPTTISELLARRRSRQMMSNPQVRRTFRRLAGALHQVPTFFEDVGRATVSRKLPDVGKKLQLARINAGHSQASISRAVGCSRGLISMVETGRQPPSSLRSIYRDRWAVELGLPLSFWDPYLTEKAEDPADGISE